MRFCASCNMPLFCVPNAATGFYRDAVADARHVYCRRPECIPSKMKHEFAICGMCGDPIFLYTNYLSFEQLTYHDDPWTGKPCWTKFCAQQIPENSSWYWHKMPNADISDEDLRYCIHLLASGGC